MNILKSVSNVKHKQKEDFWNTINGNKVNINLLTDDDVKIVEDGSRNIKKILSDFSDELQNEVKRIFEMSR